MGREYPTQTTAAVAVREHKAETGHEPLALPSNTGIVVNCNDCDEFSKPASEDSE
jgi:hypothetical protein